MPHQNAIQAEWSEALERRYHDASYRADWIRRYGREGYTPSGPTQPWGEFLPAFSSFGGYPIYYVNRDNEILCADCANRAMVEHTRASALLALFGVADDPDWEECPDWQWELIRGEWVDPDSLPIASDAHYEGATLQCDECNAEIESAYGDPDEPEEFDGNPADAPKLPDASGYRYELATGSDWRWSDPEDWDTVVSGESDGPGEFLGTRLIDDSRVNVFRLSDGRFHAVLGHACR